MVNLARNRNDQLFLMHIVVLACLVTAESICVLMDGVTVIFY